MNSVYEASSVESALNGTGTDKGKNIDVVPLVPEKTFRYLSAFFYIMERR